MLHLLKQLQNIEARPEYTERSRARILAAPRFEKRLRLNVWQVFSGVFQSGSAIALASIVLLVILGGVSAWQILKPGISALDPAGLKAEAQAIDIQIQLADVDYAESTSSVSNNSSVARVPTPTPTLTARPATNQKDATSSPQAVTVDDVLNALAE